MTDRLLPEDEGRRILNSQHAEYVSRHPELAELPFDVDDPSGVFAFLAIAGALDATRNGRNLFITLVGGDGDTQKVSYEPLDAGVAGPGVFTGSDEGLLAETLADIIVMAGLYDGQQEIDRLTGEDS